MLNDTFNMSEATNCKDHFILWCERAEQYLGADVDDTHALEAYRRRMTPYEYAKSISQEV